MKLYESGTAALVVLALATLIGLASGFFYEDDAPLEEFAEEIIEEQLGVPVDLSPNSPEQE